MDCFNYPIADGKLAGFIRIIMKYSFTEFTANACHMSTKKQQQRYKTQSWLHGTIGGRQSEQTEAQ